jgi:pimeloyl-ACP methyl ester carboxylesterase
MNFAFLHGGGQGGWVWEKTIAALHSLAPRAIALALDVPGCGKKRARNTDRLDNEAVAIDLLQDIDHALLSNVILVGHSQAGQILPFMAAMQPHVFQHLIYISCSMPLPGQSVIEMMGTGRHGDNENEVGYPEGFDLTRIKTHFPDMFCNDMAPDQQAAFLAKLGSDQWPMKTYAFTNWPTQPPPVPATYILCEQDTILPPIWQERCAQRLGASQVNKIDAGHQVMITQPHALAERLLQYAAE